MSTDSRKIEQKAVNVFRSVIDDIDGALSDISDGDRAVTFDGFIEMYQGDVSKKENYLYKVQVQVKGRTLQKDKNPKRFSLGYDDMLNMLKDNGALLLVCNFYENGSRRKLMYASLLPYALREYLMEMQNGHKKTRSLPLNEISIDNESEVLRKAIVKYHLDQEAQIRCSNDAFNGIFGGGTLNYYPGEPVTLDHLEGLLERDEYYYRMNEQGITIGVIHSRPNEITANYGNASVPSAKSTFNAVITINKDGSRLRFGQSFSLDLKAQRFNFNLKGTLDERLRDLSFFVSVIDAKRFVLNSEQSVDIDFSQISDDKLEDIRNMEKRYRNIRERLTKINVMKDIDFDVWSEHEIRILSDMLECIGSNKIFNIRKHKHELLVLHMHDLRVCVLYLHKSDAGGLLYNILSFDGSLVSNVLLQANDDGWTTSNVIYMMSKSFYMADNFNADIFRDYFDSCVYEMRDGLSLNVQALELISAYDETEDGTFLKLAQNLLDKAIEVDESNRWVYTINLLQIKYRWGALDDNDKKYLLMTKHDTKNELEKICCCVLLGHADEAKYLLADNAEGECEFRRYPIGRLLNSGS